ncbi:MAG: DUF937 domain-containing protein [Xanthomonadales bacterium]|nr:DUF937 domain-containing protein [Gammaproteobacteria bacterium]MBT8052310.1 DUF937 domain-containing protein [Gammaproteobacteria bacterium]NND55974.1 DUF937 domain-containing protein [Xanthomonadales bacterium]NNK51534.1 DUF937 domain-containing protein [Xanthomonadales bacterium]
MDLLKELMKVAGSGGLQDMGAQFGLDDEAVQKVMAQVVPALGQGMKKNVTSAGGLENLMGALQGGGHQRYLENPAAISSELGITEGNGILGHLLGSKDVSRAVAGQASAATGVSTDVIKQMLPMLATVFMGTLNKKTNAGADLKPAGDNPLGGLGSLLDSDGDGSILDDALGMAKKFF